jgi:hypothetical protein
MLPTTYQILECYLTKATYFFLKISFGRGTQGLEPRSEISHPDENKVVSCFVNKKVKMILNTKDDLHRKLKKPM